MWNKTFALSTRLYMTIVSIKTQNKASPTSCQCIHRSIHKTLHRNPTAKAQKSVFMTNPFFDFSPPSLLSETVFTFQLPAINQSPISGYRFNSIYRKELTGLCSFVLLCLYRGIYTLYFSYQIPIILLSSHTHKMSVKLGK